MSPSIQAHAPHPRGEMRASVGGDDPSDVTCGIIGGGVIGLNLAFELASRGRKVLVLDENELGHSASWAGAGILPPATFRADDEPLEQLRGLSHQYHPVLAARLKAITGIDTGFRQCGGLYIARTPGEAATLNAQQSLWEDQQIIAQAWQPNQLPQFEPALQYLSDSGRLRSIWYLPQECQLRNPRHLKALKSACELLGVHLLPHTPAKHLDILPSGQIRIDCGQQQLIADQVSICSGAWTKLLLDSLSVPNGILPIRGQMLLYRTESPILRRIVNEGHRYLVPRDDGYLLAGSCEEEAGYEIHTTAEMLTDLKAWAESLLPQLATVPIERSWAGLRPGSFDTLPYIGRVPGWQELYVAAGHYRAGLHLSCATAVVLADLMTGKQPQIDLRLFRIGRG